MLYIILLYIYIYILVCAILRVQIVINDWKVGFKFMTIGGLLSNV